MAARPLYLLVSLVLPLVSFAFFASLFGDGVMRELPLAVVDADASALSRTVLRQVDASPSVAVLPPVANMADARQMLESGKAYGILSIPTDFQRSVLRGESPDVTLYYSQLSLGVGSALSSSVQTVIGTVSAGVNLRKRELQGQMTPQAMAALQPVRVDSHVLYNPYTNYSYYLASALMPIMLQMFIIVTVIYTVGLELKESTADDWISIAGGNIVKALSGKLLPYSVIFLLLGLALNSFIFDYLKMPIHGHRFTVDFAMVLMVLAYHAVALALIVAMANLRLAVSLGAGYGAMAFSFSGLAFPISAMPTGFQYFANIFPFRFYLQSFVEQAYRAAPISYTAPQLMALIAFLFLPFLVLPRAKAVLTQSKYWGKL